MSPESILLLSGLFVLSNPKWARYFCSITNKTPFNTMKKINTVTTTMITALLILMCALPAWSQKRQKEKAGQASAMKTYVIEREIPGAGKLIAEELKGISQTSCNVLDEMGPSIKWLHSYVTENKVYCVYQATDKELIRKHAEKGGFPVNSISELSTQISPATAKRKP